jgi:hypothetical protein
MQRTTGRRPWGRAVTAVAVGLLVVGCRGKRTLTGSTVGLDSEEVSAVRELIENAVELIQAGKARRAQALLKKDLPKGEQAAVMAPLTKVASAQDWEVEGAQRFTKDYFRVAIVLRGGEGPSKVRVAVLRQGERLVFTGGG